MRIKQYCLYLFGRYIAYSEQTVLAEGNSSLHSSCGVHSSGSWYLHDKCLTNGPDIHPFSCVSKSN